MSGIDQAVLEAFLARLPGLRILALGDLMVDEYLWGGVERISPEAPVPVVDIHDETLRLGGAGNVINNLLAFGCRVVVGGVVGEDPDGRWLRDRLDEAGLDTEGIFTEPNRKTGRKTRVMTSHQQVLRIDRETRAPISGESENRLIAFVEREIPTVRAILLSDYLKGVLTDGLLKEIIALGRAHGVPVVIDPKGTDFSRYRGAALLTPNRKETRAAVQMPLADREDIVLAGRRILADLDLQQLVITLGEDGMLLLVPDGGEVRAFHFPTEVREVYDVTGAGDTVLAVLGSGLAAGLGLEQMARIANLAAGVVVGKVGTSIADPREIRAAATGVGSASRLKIKGRSELQRLLEEARRNGKKVVFTNGCFDLLHVGHLKCLEAAKAFGDLLALGLNSDESVRRLKGPGRPVISEDERGHLLAALGCVDFVTIFDEDTPEKLIEILRPDILVKGSDYSAAEVVGRDLVESYGGRVEIVNLFEGRSTSGLIESIRAAGRK